MLIFTKFEIDRDQVRLNDTIIPRPAHVSASAWLRYWEHAFQLSEEIAGRCNTVPYEDLMLGPH